MAKEMLINVSEGEECRIALVENKRLEELYMERTSSTSHVGNVYKGRVTNVEASIQAAFIDFGMGRNGFLHISDLMPTYFGRKGEDFTETVGRKMARRDRPPIQRCLRRGDEIIVQIIKEGIGTKGPTLSSYVSIPGRYLVMMPGMSKLGVSRKIEDEEERRRLRVILDQLKPPRDAGFIIRTAGVGKPKAEIQRDLQYLTRLWLNMQKKIASGQVPVELYTEGDLVTRTVRDVFTSDVEAIIVDNEEVARRIKEFIKIAMPRTKNRVELYEGTVPLFHKYGIEHEIEQMYSRHVPLPSGGSLVIDSTEAIVAIDVNSGKFRDHSDAEMTAFKTDMEAADEIPRQLRLRDLGGVIICDFIDLRYERHRRELEKRLHDNLAEDRAKTKMLRMSQFGIIEMTRQRMRPSLKRSIYFDCPHCKGSGLVKTPESMALDVMRRLAIAVNDNRVMRIELAVCPDVAFYLQNRKRAALASLEGHWKKRIVIQSDPRLGMDEMNLQLWDARDGLVFLSELGMVPPGAAPPQGRHPRPPQQQPRRDERRDGGARPDRRDQHEQRDQRGRPAQRDSRDRDSRDADSRDRDPRDQRGRPRDDRGGRHRDDRDARPRDPQHRREQRPAPSDDRFDFDQVEDAVDQREVELEDAATADEIAPPPAPLETIEAVDVPAPRRPGAREFVEVTDQDVDAALDDLDEPVAPAHADPAPEPQAEMPEPPAERGGRGRGRGRGRGGARSSSQRSPAAEPAEPQAAAPSGAANPRSASGRLGRNQRGGRGDARPEQQRPRPLESQESPAEPTDEGSEAEENASAEAKPKKRTRRGTRGGRRRKKSEVETTEMAATPIPPAVAPAVRPVSTDRHLVSDEPVLPPPISRPRTYRDLDHIPDDFD